MLIRPITPGTAEDHRLLHETKIRVFSEMISRNFFAIFSYHPFPQSNQVNSFIIFIADADGAKSLAGLLPSGCAHVALETETLPLVFKDIFTRALLSDMNQSKL